MWIVLENYANIVCMNFTEKTKSIQHARELNSQKILESPVIAVRIIERIFDNFFDFLVHEEGKEISKEKLEELRGMKEAVKKAAFTDNHSCYKIWKNLDSIFKENQWTFDALEYLEIYLATRKECITAYAKGKMLYYVFEYIIPILAEASKGDKEVFLKSIKEYNDLTTIRVDFNEGDTHHSYSEITLGEKMFLVKQYFLDHFDPKIPLELWLSIHFEATREGSNVYTESFQSKEFTDFVKEINKNKKLVDGSIITPISGVGKRKTACTVSK